MADEQNNLDKVGQAISNVLPSTAALVPGLGLVSGLTKAVGHGISSAANPQAELERNANTAGSGINSALFNIPQILTNMAGQTELGKRFLQPKSEEATAASALGNLGVGTVGNLARLAQPASKLASFLSRPILGNAADAAATQAIRGISDLQEGQDAGQYLGNTLGAGVAGGVLGGALNAGGKALGGLRQMLSNESVSAESGIPTAIRNQNADMVQMRAIRDENPVLAQSGNASEEADKQLYRALRGDNGIKTDFTNLPGPEKQNMYQKWGQNLDTRYSVLDKKLGNPENTQSILDSAAEGALGGNPVASNILDESMKTTSGLTPSELLKNLDEDQIKAIAQSLSGKAGPEIQNDISNRLAAFYDELATGNYKSIRVHLNGQGKDPGALSGIYNLAANNGSSSQGAAYAALGKYMSGVWAGVEKTAEKLAPELAGLGKDYRLYKALAPSLERAGITSGTESNSNNPGHMLWNMIGSPVNAVKNKVASGLYGTTMNAPLREAGAAMQGASANGIPARAISAMTGAGGISGGISGGNLPGPGSNGPQSDQNNPSNQGINQEESVGSQALKSMGFNMSDSEAMERGIMNKWIGDGWVYVFGPPDPKNVMWQSFHDGLVKGLTASTGNGSVDPYRLGNLLFTNPKELEQYQGQVNALKQIQDNVQKASELSTRGGALSALPFVGAPINSIYNNLAQANEAPAEAVKGAILNSAAKAGVQNTGNMIEEQVDRVLRSNAPWKSKQRILMQMLQQYNPIAAQRLMQGGQ